MNPALPRLRNIPSFLSFRVLKVMRHLYHQQYHSTTEKVPAPSPKPMGMGFEKGEKALQSGFGGVSRMRVSDLRLKYRSPNG